MEIVVGHGVLGGASKEEAAHVVLAEVALVVEDDVGIEVSHAAPGTGGIAVGANCAAEELKLVGVGDAAAYTVLRNGKALDRNLAVVFLVADTGLEVKALEEP